MLADPRRCNACDEDKPLSSFYVYKRGNRLVCSGYCRVCTVEKARQSKRRLSPEQREREHRMKVLNKHGITLDDFEEMRRIQNGRCAICGEVPDGHLCVDHDHETGHVRGLLCKPCNFALGHLKDDPLRLRAALDYLEVTSRVDRW